jgi:hypothetical protein
MHRTLKSKLIGIITVVAIIGFMVACNNNSNGINGSTTINGNYSRVVHYITNEANAENIDFGYYLNFIHDFDDSDPSAFKYTVLPLNRLGTGEWSVKVTGNSVELKLGVPNDDLIENWSVGEISGITVSDNELRIFMLSQLSNSDGNKILELGDGSEDIRVNYFYFWYADRDATVNGIENIDFEDGKNTFSYNLNIKKGWNTVIITKTSETDFTYSTAVPNNNFVWVIINDPYKNNPHYKPQIKANIEFE